MIWSLVQNLGRQGVAYVVFLLLAATIPPSAFGLVAIGSMWTTLGLVVAEMGFGPAIVQRDQLEPRHITSAFTLNVLLSVGLAAAGALASPLIARLFETPEAAPVIAALSGTLVFHGLSATHLALAQRELRFKDLATRDIVATLAGGVTGLALAAAGFGAWALVGQAAVTSAAGALLLWRLSPWRPRRSEVERRAVAELWEYSRHVFGTGIFKYAIQSSDKFIVGLVLGPTALGIYTVAFRLVLTPLQALSGAVGSFLFPALARLQGRPADALTVYRGTMHLFAAVALPALALLYLAAPVVVPLMLGPEWTPAVPVVAAMTFVGVGQLLISPVGNVLKAFGRPDWLLRSAIWHAAVTSIAILLGARFGIAGVGWGMVVAYALTVPVNAWMARRFLPLVPADIGRMLGVPLLASGALAVTGAAVLPLNLGDRGSMAALVVTGLAVYLTVLWLLDRTGLREGWTALRAPRSAHGVMPAVETESLADQPGIP